MAIPAFVGPALSLLSTGFKVALIYISGKLSRQKSQLEANREARKIDSEVDAGGADAARERMLARRRDNDRG